MAEFYSSKRTQGDRLAYFGGHAFENTRWSMQPMRQRRLRARRPFIGPEAAGRPSR